MQGWSAEKPRRRSLGYSDAGVRLNVSFGEDEASPAAGVTREAISPGWLARDRAKQDQVAREKQGARVRTDSIAVRARAMNNRVGIRETDSVRFARASPRHVHRGTGTSSPRSPRSASTAASAHGKPASAHKHAARPRIHGSQRAVGKTTEDLWRRSSATEYVRSLQSLSDTLNHPRPLVQVTARQSIDSVVRKERASAATTATGRMSAAEFVKKLQDSTSVRSDRAGSSQPPWRERKQKVESVSQVAAPSTPEPEPSRALEFRTPPRDAAPVTAQTASSFSEWYAANKSEPEPEPEPCSDTETQLLLQPASPPQADQSYSPLHANGTWVSESQAEVTSASTATAPHYSVRQHRSYGGSMPVASPRTVERRQRVHALASAARRE
eukprot:COSAG02_NODE_1855_length_10650_cov_4.154677_4_plen_384_part_00